MLTKSDIQKVGQIVKTVIDAELFEIKEEVKKIEHLPSKKEYYKREDEMMTELQNIRDDISTMVGWRDEIEKNKSDIHLLADHVGVTLTS